MLDIYLNIKRSADIKIQNMVLENKKKRKKSAGIRGTVKKERTKTRKRKSNRNWKDEGGEST